MAVTEKEIIMIPGGKLGTLRMQLLMFLDEARLNTILEQHLTDALYDVREARAKADKLTTALIRACEHGDMTPEQWRILLDGTHPQVAAALGRNERHGH